MSATDRPAPFTLETVTVGAGRKRIVDVPLGRLPTGTDVAMQVAVIHGARKGPTMWINGAIHGDEINGVEIVRAIVAGLDATSLAGTVLAVPVVNVQGFITESRYLPDRRDLNRSFPGSPRGSVAARVAHVFMSTIVERCEIGIDFHTGTDHRANLPHIRADLDDPVTSRLAAAFGAGVMVHAAVRDGSLRGAATATGRRALVYEGGQAHRFDADAVSTGIDGTRRVLADLGMLEPSESPARRTMEIRSTTWVRARRSGVTRVTVDLGERIATGTPVAEIGDVLGGRPSVVRSPIDAIVIGVRRNPLVHRGDALANLGRV